MSAAIDGTPTMLFEGRIAQHFAEADDCVDRLRCEIELPGHTEVYICRSVTGNTPFFVAADPKFGNLG